MLEPLLKGLGLTGLPGAAEGPAAALPGAAKAAAAGGAALAAPPLEGVLADAAQGGEPLVSQTGAVQQLGDIGRGAPGPPVRWGRGGGSMAFLMDRLMRLLSSMPMTLTLTSCPSVR